MKRGRASKTAELVCMGRAIGHGQSGFEDPTAIELLPEAARERVEAIRANTKPRSLAEGVFRGYLARQAKVMIARTTAIDAVIRNADAAQLVILGAGLDGRAWRMKELERTTVFEIDHPDTQKDKRSRIDAGRLSQHAKDVRFVPVDFQKDSLEDALSGALHDPSRPTMWVWEGVVMYLTRDAIEATLEVIAKRSAKGSVLVLHYHSPAIFLRVVGLVVGALGEPFRSRFRSEEMRALLDRHGFMVTEDASIADLGGPSVASHLRMATSLRR